MSYFIASLVNRCSESSKAQDMEKNPPSEVVTLIVDLALIALAANLAFSIGSIPAWGSWSLVGASGALFLLNTILFSINQCKKREEVKESQPQAEVEVESPPLSIFGSSRESTQATLEIQKKSIERIDTFDKYRISHLSIEELRKKENSLAGINLDEVQVQLTTYKQMLSEAQDQLLYDNELKKIGRQAPRLSTILQSIQWQIRKPETFAAFFVTPVG